MHSALFGYFLDALTQLVSEAKQAVTSSTDAYALAVTGVSEAQVYQAVLGPH